MVGVSQDVVARWLNENDIAFNLTPKKVIMNNHFFDEIDTEEKAYWLGFVWSDGSVTYDKKNDRYSLKIDLSSMDKNHLEKLKKSWKSSAIIKIYEHGEGGYESDYQVCRLVSNSRHMCDILRSKYGMIPHRTCGDRLFGFVPENLHRHLIRGIMDADGSIIISKDKHNREQYLLNFTVTNSIANHIEYYLLSKKLVRQKVVRTKRNIGRDGDVIRISYGGGIQVPRVLDHLYDGSLNYLQRKHNLYKKIIECRRVFECID